MAEWKSANLAATIPASFTALTATASASVSAMSAVLGPLADAISAISAVVVDIPPFDAAAALSAAIDVFIEDFRKTGLYYLPLFDAGLEDYLNIRANFPTPDDGPVPEVNLPGFTFHTETFQRAGQQDKSFSDRFSSNFFGRYAESVTSVDSTDPTLRVVNPSIPSTGGAIDRFRLRIAASFDDRGDQNKPTFQTPVAGIVLMAAMPTMADYYNLMTEMADVWLNLREWRAAATQAERIINRAGWTNPVNVPGFRYSIPPDWTNISFEKVFPYVWQGIDAFMKPMADAMRAGAGIGKSIEFMGTLLAEKVSSLSTQLDGFSALLASLDSVLSATGLYALYITADSGVSGFVQTLNTTPLPPELEELNRQDAIVGGMVLLGGSSLLVPIEAFFGGLA